MSYEEAKKLIDNNTNITNQEYRDADNSFTITDILIAPKNSTLQEKITLLKEMHTAGMGNENALINASVVNEDLDVYIIGKGDNNYQVGLLRDHLKRLE